MEPNNGPREVLTAIVAKEDWLQLLRQWPLLLSASTAQTCQRNTIPKRVVVCCMFRAIEVNLYSTQQPLLERYVKKKRKSSSGL